MNARAPFSSLLANRYSAGAAGLCGAVQTQHSQIVGLRSGQQKPIQSQRKGEARKTLDK